MVSVGERYRHNVDQKIYRVTKVGGSAVVLQTPSNLEMIVSLAKLSKEYTKER